MTAPLVRVASGGFAHLRPRYGESNPLVPLEPRPEAHQAHTRSVSRRRESADPHPYQTFSHPPYHLVSTSAGAIPVGHSRAAYYYVVVCEQPRRCQIKTPHLRNFDMPRLCMVSHISSEWRCSKPS